MANISAEAVKELREATGLGMMECKKLLAEVNGDLAQAMKIARERGMEKLGKVRGKEASEGLVEFYRHHDGKLGVMIELNCNTDFVARNESFGQLARDLCMHIAARNPQVITREQLDQTLVTAIRAHHASEVDSKKPKEIIEKIVDGKMKSWFEERVLLDQNYVKDDSRTIKQLLDEAASKTGENVSIGRFARFQVGASGEPAEG